jgi:hypothetical protein
VNLAPFGHRVKMVMDNSSLPLISYDTDPCPL